MYKYNLSLIPHAQLAVALGSSDLTMQLMPGEGAEFTQPPCIAVLSTSRTLTDLSNAEHVKITDRTSDVLTIERAVIGSAADWGVGTLVLGFWSPEHINQIYSSLDMIEFLINKSVGGGKQNVVIFQTGYDFAATAGSGLSVDVTPGSCFIDYELLSVIDATNITFTAPVSSTRVDIIQANKIARSVEKKLGTEGGSAPSADTDCIALWEITTTVGQSTRVSGDIVDVRPS